MHEIKLKIRRTYDDEIEYEGKDILMAEALVKLAKLNPKPKSTEDEA